MNNSNYLTEYSNFLKENAFEVLGKREGITAGDIKKLIPAHARHGDHPTEINIKFKKYYDVEFASHSYDATYGVKQIAQFLNSKDGHKDDWFLALVAQVFNLPTKKEFDLNKRSTAVSLSPFERLFKKQLQDSEQTYNWESTLLLLIDYLNRSNVKKLTISVDDLHFVFKIIPTLIHFFINLGHPIQIVYAPRHGYGLMSVKELMALWKLGIPISILKFQESLSEKTELGFIFNWLPTDGTPTNNEIYENGIEMIRIKTISFDRYPFSTNIKCSNTGEIFTSITNILGKIDEKNSGFLGSLPIQKQAFRPIPPADYKKWMENRFSTATKSLFHNCSCEFEEVKADLIYYRHTSLVRYKVYQAYKILSSVNDHKNNHLFQPFNLFDNQEMGFYPTNPPILEYNPYQDRYEIGEGHHRICALHLFSKMPLVNAVVVRGIREDAFNEKVDSASIIKNEWGNIFDLVTDFHRQDIQVYERRHIETITHSISNSIYRELGDFLSEKGIMSKEEANKFSHRKYQYN